MPHNMKTRGKLICFTIFILLTFSTGVLSAQSDTVQYLFMGHTRDDDRVNEHLLYTIEKLDYGKYELLLLGGDLMWSTSALTSTLDYCDSILKLGDPDTHLAAGNHDLADVAALLSYTKKERYHCFSKNNITFLILDTEISTPDITGGQLDMIKTVADTIQQSEYLVLVHHRILWMAGNPDLEQLRDSVAASSKNLSASNFFDEVYPELQKVKGKGIPVFCIAGDRTDINIEYAKEDSIQFIASGMVGTFPDENNYTVVLTHIPAEHLLTYQFVPLSEMDTVGGTTVRIPEYLFNAGIKFELFPNPSPGKFNIQLSEPDHAEMKAEIFSMQGVRLFEAEIPLNENSITINADGLVEGLYFIRIGDDRRSRTEKIFLTGEF